MPNTETLRALVSAFNVHNYARNTVETNFTLQSRGKKDYIVVSFDKSMDTYQCSEYLDSIKRKIIREFYGIEESNDAEILDTAKLIFDVNSFPFNISDRDWSWDKQHGFKFVTPVDKGIIFNLKSHLASSLKKDVLEDMRVSSTTIASNKKKYLWHDKFDNEELCQQFKSMFLSKMRERYENVPKNPLKIEGNDVYIKDVFDDARFIDSVTRYIAWLEGMGLHDDSKNYSEAKAFKDLIMEFIDQSIGLTVAGFIRNFPLNEKTAKILIPVVLDNGEPRILASEEALELNCAFNYAVFNDLYGKTQGELSVNGDSGIYGIDFSNKEISHCVITKIIESSVINKDHELAIDPEIRLQALSPAQSPVRMPNGPSSGLTGTSIQGFPTRSQGKELEGSPRQGLLSVVPLNPLDIPGTSREFLPSTWMSSTAVSQHAQLEKCVGAAQNVRAGTSASSRWLSQSTSENKWIPPMQLPEPGPSGLSWKGANPVGTDRWSLLAPSTGLRSLPQSGPSSWKGANPVGTNPWAQQTNHWSSSKDADKDAKTTWYVPLPLTTGNDPLQVTDKSVQGARGEPLAPLASDENDRESSDECSEAKSQKSESPKKHGSSFQKVKDFFSSPFKSKQHDVSLKRCDVGRDTTQSMPTISVTKKPPLSERSASERKAKSNPPSKVTSPVHSTINGSIPGLPSQGTTVVESSSGPKRQTSLTPSQRKELYKVLSDEMKGKLNSSSFPPEYEELLYLLYVDKRELRLLLSDPKAKQVCSVLPPEKIEQVQSSFPEEVLGLLHTFFSNQKISDNFLISSKVDSPKTEKHLQKEREVFV